MNVAQRFTTPMKVRHRIDATILELQRDYVVAQCDHRCDPYCELLRDHAATLTLSGRRNFRYADFAAQFVPMAEDAIALSGGS